MSLIGRRRVDLLMFSRSWRLFFNGPCGIMVDVRYLARIHAFLKLSEIVSHWHYAIITTQLEM